MLYIVYCIFWVAISSFLSYYITLCLLIAVFVVYNAVLILYFMSHYFVLLSYYTLLHCQPPLVAPIDSWTTPALAFHRIYNTTDTPLRQNTPFPSTPQNNYSTDQPHRWHGRLFHAPQINQRALSRISVHWSLSKRCLCFRLKTGRA